MNQANRPAHSFLRTGAGILAGLLAAILAPVLLATSSVLFIYPVLAMVIYAFAGAGAAICAIAVNILAFDLYLGIPGVIVSVAAFAMPSAVMIRSAKWRRSMRDQLRSAIAAQVAGILAALIALRLYIGTDLIDVFVSMLREYMAQVPPELLDAVLVRFFNGGMLNVGANSQELVGAILTQTQRADYLDAFAIQIKNSLALTMPGMLLSSAAVTGIMGTLLANYMLRKEQGREMCYLPVSRWFTPWQVSLGLIVMLGAAYLLYSFGLKGADAVYMTLLTLLRTAFMIQAAISLERHLQALGRRGWVRVLLIAAMLIFIPTAAVIYGGISAMFGVHGAFKQLRVRRRKGSGDDDI